MIVEPGAPAPWQQGLLGTRAAGRDRTMGSPVVSSRQVRTPAAKEQLEFGRMARSVLMF